MPYQLGDTPIQNTDDSSYFAEFKLSFYQLFKRALSRFPTTDGLKSQFLALFNLILMASLITRLSRPFTLKCRYRLLRPRLDLYPT